MVGKISGVFTHQCYGTKWDQQSCYSDGLTSKKEIVFKNVLNEAENNIQGPTPDEVLNDGWEQSLL